jgi:predicted acetyltransferase
LPDVRVSPATAEERPLLERLAQFYIYDFSELDPDRHPLLIRVGDKIAGFALINTHSHRGGRVERNMAEFFVARKFRRRGVAREAVRQILALYPGRWEVAAAERNATAKAFWPGAIAAAGVSGLTRVEGDGAHWRGPIWIFEVEG